MHIPADLGGEDVTGRTVFQYMNEDTIICTKALLDTCTHNIVTRNINLSPEITGMVTEVQGIGMAKSVSHPVRSWYFWDRATSFRFWGGCCWVKYIKGELDDLTCT